MSDSPLGNLTEQQRRDFWTNVLYQLTDSQRFLNFLDSNYSIVIQKNDEEKTVNILVTEKPTAVGPKLSGEQIFKMQATCMNAGAKDSADLVRRLLKILGQEDGRLVTTASDADLNKLIKS
jgi:hypothetical protein